jgi:hypothetical protein
MMRDEHFDMHEDIAETRQHLIDGHHAVPEVDAGTIGQGPAEVLAAQHARLHRILSADFSDVEARLAAAPEKPRRRWFFTFGIAMFLVGGRVRQGLGGDVAGLPLSGHYVTILAHTEDEAREKMLAVFGHFASAYDEQHGHEVVQRRGMTPLLAGGDLQ